MDFKKHLSPEAAHRESVVDMEPVLKRIPPIEGVFNPNEEVGKLLSLPREQRRESIANFKNKLARQREAWGLCRTTIEERIEDNPDLSREEMTGIIHKFALHYGFAEAHIRVAELLVDDYIKIHKRVNETRERFPDDIALINRLTERKFNQSDASDFEVSVGPMSIEIICSGFNAGKIYRSRMIPGMGFRYGGFASYSKDKFPIYYLVVNRDYKTTNPKFYVATIPHERYHQEDRIIAPKLFRVSGVREDVRKILNRGIRRFLRHQIGEKIFGFERQFEKEVYSRYESVKKPQEKSFFLAEYMRLKREHALNCVKNELFALKSEPDYPRSSRDIFNIFMHGSGGNAYDYLAELRVEKSNSLWHDTAQRVLVYEYGKIINAAIQTFDQFVSSGYTNKEAIAMLSDKRMQEWPKTVRRLLEQKQQYRFSKNS